LEQSDGAYERNPQAAIGKYIIISIVSTKEEKKKKNSDRESAKMQGNPILLFQGKNKKRKGKGKYHS
jgi:hypothetical protein